MKRVVVRKKKGKRAAIAGAQLLLAARGRRGGYRAGAGRPAIAPEKRKGHGVRPELAKRFPVHVTLKCVEGAPHLRRGVCFRTLRKCFVKGKEKANFRMVHFSVQGNHLHFICEADDRMALARGMQGLAIRVARRLNRRIGRKGRLFAARYHSRILRSPTEVRNALSYVLKNARHHRRDSGGLGRSSWIDPMSSAPFFDGWKYQPREPWARPTGDRPVAVAKTWFLTTGWKRLGLLVPGEPAKPARA